MRGRGYRQKFREALDYPEQRGGQVGHEQ